MAAKLIKWQFGHDNNNNSYIMSKIWEYPVRKYIYIDVSMQE